MNSGRIERPDWRTTPNPRPEQLEAQSLPIRKSSAGVGQRPTETKAKTAAQAETANKTKADSVDRANVIGGWQRAVPLRADRQNLAERLSRLAEFLAPADAALVQARFAHGRNYREIGLLTNQNSSTLRAKVHRLVRRVQTPAFRYAARELNRMEPERAAVAKLCLLCGLPTRTASVQLGMTVHRVNMHRRALIELANQETRREKPTRR